MERCKSKRALAKMRSMDERQKNKKRSKRREREYHKTCVSVHIKACMLVHAYPRLFLDSSMKFDCVASVKRSHGGVGTKRFIPRTHLSHCEPGSWSSMAVSVVAVFPASGASIRIIPFLGALIPRSADIFSPQQMQQSARARTHKPLRWWT